MWVESDIVIAVGDDGGMTEPISLDAHWDDQGVIEKFYGVSLDPEKRITKRGITILPCQQFLKLLWTDQLF